MSVGPLWPQTFVFPWVTPRTSALEAVPQGPQCLGQCAPKSRGREKAGRFPPDCPLLYGSSSSTFIIWFQLGFEQEPWDEGHGREGVACLARSCLKSPSWPGSGLCVLVVDEVTGSPKSRGAGPSGQKADELKGGQSGLWYPQNQQPIWAREFLVNHGPSKDCSSKGARMWDLAQARCSTFCCCSACSEVKYLVNAL